MLNQITPVEVNLEEIKSPFNLLVNCFQYYSYLDDNNNAIKVSSPLQAAIALCI